MPWRILNTEPSRFSAAAREALRAIGEVTEVEADRAYLLANVQHFEVLFVALRNPLDREIITRGARLKYIVTPTTGVDHIDSAAAHEQQVALLTLRGELEFLRTVTATAELTWALLLSLIRRIPAATASVARGDWQRDLFYGTELQGKTLGVIGLGRLGQMVAGYGVAFRMNVLAFDHRQDRPAAPGIRLVPLGELLQQSDVVSIHLPLDEQTRGFFAATHLAAMRDGALLINTARGEIIDEHALVDALSRGKLAGAAVDVLAGETSLDPQWLRHSPLAAYARLHHNVLITPHIGGVTHESVERANRFMIDKLARHLANLSETSCHKGLK